jgi:hypothetical protein
MAEVRSGAGFGLSRSGSRISINPVKARLDGERKQIMKLKTFRDDMTLSVLLQTAKIRKRDCLRMAELHL